MQSMADRVYEIMRSLPDSKAVEILNFAESIQADTEASEGDFFALAGIWEGRNVNADSLRKKAWPEQKP